MVKHLAINYNQMKTTPHSFRVMGIYAWLLGLLAIIILLACGCRPQRGCRSTHGMSGYSWFRCIETKKVAILDSTGGIICSFIDKSGMMKSRQ